MSVPVSDRLTFARGREFVAFLDSIRGTDGIIRRSAFGPEDLRRWLGGIGIMQWNAGRGDYVYRLFGTSLAQNLGRDLTGLTLAEWPPAVAQIMRDQADSARMRHTIVVSHYRLRVFRRNGVVEDGLQTQEKIVAPIAYSDVGPPDAVLVYVDQQFSDIPILRAHMTATDGSCWCTADRAPCSGCPMEA